MGIDIKEFRKIVSDLGKNNSEFQEISQAVLKTLTPGEQGYSNISKETQQNILNSLMETDIENMIINHLPEVFNYRRHTFAKKVIETIKNKGTQLY